MINYSSSTYTALGDASSATFKQDDQGLYIEYSKTGTDSTIRLIKIKFV